MKLINFITSVTDEFILKAQWDTSRFPQDQYAIYFNSSEDIAWDLVVVYENISAPIKLKINKGGGCVYFGAEPPIAHPVGALFIKQFDKVILPHRLFVGRGIKWNAHPSHGYLAWQSVMSSEDGHILDFNEIKGMPKLTKTLNISIVTSTTKVLPGHFRRTLVIKRLMRDFPGCIDLYGKGYKVIENKHDALDNYRFHICFENTSNRFYWSEKIADPLISYTVPIYLGCKTISKYFDSDGMISLKYIEYKKLKKIIGSIILSPDEMYNLYAPAMIRNRNALLTTHNLVNKVIELSNGGGYKGGSGNSGNKKEIFPMEYNTHSFPFICLRIVHKIGAIYYAIVEKFLLVLNIIDK